MPDGRDRPTALTVFGVLNIVFGGIIALVALGSLVFALIRPAETPIRVWGYVGNSLSLKGAIVLIAAGAGLLRLRSWARIASLVWAAFYIVFICINAVVTIMIMPGLVAQQPGAQSLPPGMVDTFVVLGGIFGACFWIIYPVVLIIFMMRRSVVEALAAPPAPGDRAW